MKKTIRIASLAVAACLLAGAGTATAQIQMDGVPNAIRETLQGFSGPDFNLRYGSDGSISLETAAGTQRFLPVMPPGLLNPAAVGGELIFNPDGSVGFGQGGQAEIIYAPIEDDAGRYPGFPAGFQPPAGAFMPSNITLPPGFVPPTNLNVDLSRIPPLPPNAFLAEFGLSEGVDFTVGEDGSIDLQGMRFVPFLDPNGTVGVPRRGASVTFSVEADGSVVFPDGTVFAPVELDLSGLPSFPAGFTPPPDLIMPANVQLPENFFFSSNIPLPAGMRLPPNARFGDGMMLPPDIELPPGMTLDDLRAGGVFIPEQQMNADGFSTLFDVPEGMPLPPGAVRNPDGSIQVPPPPSFSDPRLSGPWAGIDTEYLGATYNDDGTMTLPNGMIINMPPSNGHMPPDGYMPDGHMPDGYMPDGYDGYTLGPDAQWEEHYYHWDANVPTDGNYLEPGMTPYPGAGLPYYPYF